MAKIRKRVSKKKRIDRHEEFLGFYEKSIEYIRRKKSSFLFTSGILLVLIIILATIFLLNIYYNDKASALEYEAYRYYTIDKSYPEVRISVEERYKKALNLYQEVVSKYPRTKKAPLALYGVGNCYFQLKMTDEAEKSYKLLIEKYPENNFMLPLIYQKLGYLYKIKGNSDEALKNFEKLTAIETGMKDLAYIEIGRIHEAQGRKEEAIKNYQKIVENFPSSPWSSEAKRKLEDLKK